MKEAINFAWPVTSINKEDYDAFNNCILKNSEILQNSQIIIWGGGIRGTEFSIILKKRGYEKVIFVDNNKQKWGGFINDSPIVSPDDFFNMKIKYFIIISTEECYDIVNQLNLKGLTDGIDYTTVKNNLYEKYMEEFERNYLNEILIMGDCEFSKISLKDNNLDNLGELLKKRVGKNNLKVLAMHGMGLRAHYNSFISQIQLGMKPKMLVIMINLDTLTGKQHLLPRSQHVELIKRIWQVMPVKEDELNKYLDTVNDRYKNIQSEFFTTAKKISNSEQNKIMQAKVYFKLNYLYNLDTNTEGLQYLIKILDKCKLERIKVIPFIPPVNYEYAKMIFGNDFFIKYESNIRKIQKITSEGGFELLDLSYSLKKEFFAETDTPDETMNEKGRSVITEKLYEELMEEI